MADHQQQGVCECGHRKMTHILDPRDAQCLVCGCEGYREPNRG